MTTTRRPLAIVTGGARGIGLATAQALASSGFHVVVVDAPGASSMPYPLSTEPDLARIRDQHIQPEPCDVRKASHLTRLVARLIRTLGPVHVAVACAGVLAGSTSSLELDNEQAQEIFDVDYWGVVHLAAATMPSLRTTRGSFIAITSAAGLRGLPQLGHYCAAKHAVHGFLAALAREELPVGVHINIVAPGSTDTAILQATADVYHLASPADFLAQQLDPILNTPADVASVVAFLANNPTSGINAATISVDRGFQG
ncbi:SDR family oxidoreductase [Ferrimicrobium sp.]|uniref:SDR family oxidoreductase n=1 Tax=Ferrimicrobium sp. TaxID=2926050 RepID=UPI00262119F4|nr:SDR family oxidoreductase [Ferrimicrobium sp.]